MSFPPETAGKGHIEKGLWLGAHRPLQPSTLANHLRLGELEILDEGYARGTAERAGAAFDTFLSEKTIKGIIILMLGIVGEYVGRMFLTMGNYPQYVVREIYGKNKEEAQK